MVDYELTEHAKQMIAERGISIKWVEYVLNSPMKTERDYSQPDLRHSFGRIAKYGNRVLRVVYNGSAKPKRVVTVYFDRTMKEKI